MRYACVGRGDAGAHFRTSFHSANAPYFRDFTILSVLNWGLMTNLAFGDTFLFVLERGLGKGLTTRQRKSQHVKKYYTEPRTRRSLLNTVMKLRVP
jgi:hypothetical protein